MTLKEMKEQERKAYIEGDVEKAKILGKLIDYWYKAYRWETSTK
jgi:hypothetical protein